MFKCRYTQDLHYFQVLVALCCYHHHAQSHLHVLKPSQKYAHGCRPICEQGRPMVTASAAADQTTRAPTPHAERANLRSMSDP
jgi:hypothetical protein